MQRKDTGPMRLIWLMLLMLLLMLLAPAVQAAPVFESPRDLLEHAYEPYRDGGFPEDPYQYWSPALLERWALMVARTPDDEVGAVNFDPMINAQDHAIGVISIGETVLAGDIATVKVKFSNFGEPQELRFTVVRGEGGWRIDDIEALTPGQDWRLTDLLESPPG